MVTCLPRTWRSWRYRIPHWLLGITLCLSLPGWLQAQPAVQVWVTVDWEGLSLDEDNLSAMRAFRQQFPDIPFLHLINPTYFLVPQAARAQASRAIRSTFLPQDTVGLHLHPQRQLVEVCGVLFQSAPAISPAEADCAGATCGHGVSLEFAYTQRELSDLVACASRLLVQNGFRRPQHFRAGAWQAGPQLYAALLEHGFVWDSSRIAPQLLTTRWPEDSPLIQRLQQLHPSAQPLEKTLEQTLEQPFALTSQLQVYPNNAALADYATTAQWIQLFATLLAQHKQVMVLGFHQESASEYLWRLARAIPHMQALAKQHQVPLLWMPSAMTD